MKSDEPAALSLRPQHALEALLTETVRTWHGYGPATLPLPHPSPRNNIWLQRNPWFELEVVPTLRARVQALR